MMANNEEAENMEDNGSKPKRAKLNEYEQREYQAFLLERAKAENVIICLPTGCGKTFIAEQLIEAYLQETIDAGKKIVFLASTVPLVIQQGRYLKDHFGNKYSNANTHIGIVTGDQKPEDWDGSKWREILSKHIVFSMTDNILRQAIERAHITLDQITLLVLDECHNATGNHHMAQVMDFYRKALNGGGVINETLPRILGLSATIVTGNSKLDLVEKDVEAVERRFCCKAITYHAYEEVISCATSAEIKMIPYRPNVTAEVEFGERKFKLVDILEETMTNLQEMELFLANPSETNHLIIDSTLKDESQVFGGKKKERPMQEFIKHVREVRDILLQMGPFCTKIAVMLKEANLTYIKLQNNRQGTRLTANDLAVDYIETQFELVKRQLDNLMYLVTGSQSERDHIVCRDLISPKLGSLVSELAAMRPTENSEVIRPVYGLIFCERRIATQILNYYILDLSRLCVESFGFLNCGFALGTGGTAHAIGAKEAKISIAKQTEVLDKFRQKQLNVLVATKVLEEGLNVPSCNFVIRFDPIMSYPSFIQSMGRARQRDAKFYIFVQHDMVESEKNKIESYKAFSGALASVLRNRDLPERFLNPDNEGIDENELNERVPPFRSPNGPQQITAMSAIERVLSYCETLSIDKFSALAPVAWWVLEGSMYQVKLRLPPNACVTEAESGFFSSKYVAKKAAYLEMCKKLYEAGALHPVTLFPYPKNAQKFSSEFLDEIEKNTVQPTDGKKVGSKNRQQWYPKMIPQVFQPSLGKGELHVYSLKITLKSYLGADIPELRNLLELAHQKYTFGIVTTADLANVPDFILFSRDGNFQVHAERVDHYDEHGKSMNLADHLEAFASFQSQVFTDSELLNLRHPIQKPDPKPQYCIVPLKPRGDDEGGVIVALDLIWKMVDKKEVDYNEKLSVADRRTMSISAEQYSDALVIPWYSPSYNKKMSYCVLSYRTDMTPLSDFPDKQHPNYEVYFKRKYDIDLVHTSRPVLEGKAVSKQLNYLVAKYHRWKMTKSEKSDDKFCSSCVTIMPELVRIHPLPASLFVQAKMLPSCLHRINRLLLAEEILQSVAKNCVDGPQTYSDDVRNESELQMLSQEVTKMAIPLLKQTISNVEPTDTNGLRVFRPTHSSNYAESVVVQDFRPFYRRKVMSWAELEYAHPREMKLEDIAAINDTDNDEEDYNPPSPTIAAACGIELINPEDGPQQEFHKDVETTGCPTATTIMQALTLANGNDFFSLEKLEMIGDSVLKLIVTLHIFTHFSNKNEGFLTFLRTRLISNQHLYQCVVKKGLGEILAGSLFEPVTSWLPPGFEIPQKLTEIAVNNGVNYSVYLPLRNHENGNMETIYLDSMTDDEISKAVADRKTNMRKQMQGEGPLHTSYTHSLIGDKSIADCAEALIGAYYIDGGLTGALTVMQWLGLQGPTPDPTKSFPYKAIKDLPSLSTIYPTEEKTNITFLSEIEEVLKYVFKNKWLLVEALTHPSSLPLQQAKTDAYQRLEFLGDAVLVTHFIYKSKTAETPGKLTDLRSALVNNITFGSLSVRYGFHKSLKHFSPKLRDAINLFASCQQRNGHKTGENLRLITDAECTVAEDIEVPKALGDIFESIAGAVFIDSGRNLDTVWTVFYRLMKNEFDTFSENIPINPVRQLYEEFPGRLTFESCTQNSDSGTKKVSVKVDGYRSFEGCGPTKKTAKEAASKYAIKYFKDLKIMK